MKQGTELKEGMPIWAKIDLQTFEGEKLCSVNDRLELMEFDKKRFNVKCGSHICNFEWNKFDRYFTTVDPNKKPNEESAPILVERFADNGQHSHWDLIDNEGVVLYSTIPDAEEMVEKPFWSNLNESKPHAWETGNWGGKKSDYVFVLDKDGRADVCEMYEGFIDGSEFINFFDADDNEIENVVKWAYIPDEYNSGVSAKNAHTDLIKCCEDSTGQTQVFCCNKCGNPVEKDWAVEPTDAVLPIFKSLQEIKDLVAERGGYKSWKDRISDKGLGRYDKIGQIQVLMNNVAGLYANQYKTAYENALKENQSLSFENSRINSELDRLASEILRLGDELRRSKL